MKMKSDCLGYRVKSSGLFVTRCQDGVEVKSTLVRTRPIERSSALRLLADWLDAGYVVGNIVAVVKKAKKSNRKRKFDVELVRTTVEGCVITVEARDEDDAGDIALDTVTDEGWEHTDGEDASVVEVTESER